MSRREGRDSHARRLRSSRDDPSPKRAREDMKLATDGAHSSSRTKDSAKTSDHDQKRSRSLQDAAEHKDPSHAEPKVLIDPKNGSAVKSDRSPRGTKRFSDSREVAQSRSHFQHDDRRSAGQGGRHYDRRATDIGRHSNQKEHLGDRDKDKTEGHGLQEKGELARPHSDGDSVWKHDGFFQLEAEPPQAKKRPAFREVKMPLELEPATAVTELDPRSHKSDQPESAITRKEERGNHHSRWSDKPEVPFRRTDERSARREYSDHRTHMRRNDYESRGRFAGRGGRGRDRSSNWYGERNTYRSAGVQVDKWKHDLYDQANRSPTPKNEEEQIAKVEALLAL